MEPSTWETAWSRTVVLVDFSALAGDKCVELLGILVDELRDTSPTLHV
jgi:hypothetical protein